MKSSGGGAFVLLQRLLEGLAAKGHAVKYFAPEPFPSLAGTTARFVRISCSSVPAFLRAAIFCLRLNARARQQAGSGGGGGIIAQSGLYAAAMSPLLRTGARLLTLRHGDDARELAAAGYSRFASRILTAIAEKGLKQSDTIVAVSQDLADTTARHLPEVETKVVVQHNAIPEMPEVQERDVLALKSRFNLEGKVVLAFVGPLKPIKRVDILLHAVANLRQRFPIKLFVVGSGPEENRLRQLASRLDIKQEVVFTGWLQNPFSYMKASHMVVLPSDYEGSPLVLLEALGQGVVVIGSRTGGIPEILIDDRLLFEPGNPVALANCFLDAVDNSGRVRPGITEICARRAATFRFDWTETMIKRIQYLSSIQGENTPTASS